MARIGGQVASRRRVIVAGAAGVFGSLLAGELRARGQFDVVATTRAGLDLRDRDAVRRAVAGAFALCCCAGPFELLDPAIVRAVVDEGVHWLDIADDPAWFFSLEGDATLDRAARERGVVVCSGLSTLPAISTALVRRLVRETGAASPVTITLRIGNRNAKGAGAIASALGSAGGILRTPDRTLLQREGIEAHARVEFEWPVATFLMRMVSGLRLSGGTRRRIGKVLSTIAAPMSRFGSDAGEVRVAAGSVSRSVRGHGQRMAILPIALALQTLAGGGRPASGCLVPSQLLDDDSLLSFVENSA